MPVYAPCGCIMAEIFIKIFQSAKTTKKMPEKASCKTQVKQSEITSISFQQTLRAF